jgi:hypothetical protein
MVHFREGLIKGMEVAVEGRTTVAIEGSTDLSGNIFYWYVLAIQPSGSIVEVMHNFSNPHLFGVAENQTAEQQNIESR